MGPWGSRLGLGVAIWGMIVGWAAGAETPPAAMLGQSTGVFAIQDALGQPWRILTQGDRLPEKPPCQLRSGFTGSSLLQLPGTTLRLGPETQLQLDRPARRLTLPLGKVLVTTEPQKTWTVTTGELNVILDPQSTAEVTVGLGAPVTVYVAQGAAQLSAAKGKPTPVPAGSQAVWTASDKQPAVTKLDVTEQKRIVSWANAAASQGLGQLLIKDAQSDTVRRLDVARYHVNVVLQPPVALVQIDQAFYNPHKSVEEGTFVFNLPRGASVSRFAMYVTPTELVEGELIERQRAVSVYESIVRQRRDPALLEQIGDNLFRIRVFPIPARDVKRILLDYTIPLEADEGAYQFQLPLLSDLKPIGDFRLTGTIKGLTRPESVASWSHPLLKVERRGDRLTAFQFASRNYRPQTDFLLEFAQPGGGEPEFRSYRAAPLLQDGQQRNRGGDDWAGRTATYFLAAIPPGPENRPDTSPADVLILADTSEGMRKNGRLSKALRMILHNLRPCDRFQLACVDVGARALTERWIEAGSPERQAALTRFDQEFCLGGTDLVTSLREAVERFDSQSPSRRRVCVYLGDGEDTLSVPKEKPIPRLVADMLIQAKASLFAVIVRRCLEGTPLLESVAQASGGQVFDLTGSSGERELLRWVLNVPQPERIVSMEVEGVEPEDLFYAPAWLPGRPLYVLGRMRETEQVRLSLTVFRGGKRVVRQWEFNCRDKDDDLFVGRLWAQKKLDRLRLRVTDANPPEQVRAPIVALSQEWSLLSPYTAFLVLEGEADYQRWDIARRQRRPYWRPADAMPQAPLPGDWVALAGDEALKLRKEAEARQYAEAIVSARAALAAKDPLRAHTLLVRVKDNPHAIGPEYAKLSRQAQADAEAERLAGQLGLHRGLLDPKARKGWERPTPSVFWFLHGVSGVSPDFTRRHPYYSPLLQEVRVETRGAKGDFRLQDLQGELRALTGANVWLDTPALRDLGFSPDSPIEVQGWGKMSLRAYTRFVLRQYGLVLVEEPHRLLITSSERAESRLTTEVYPLADLYSGVGPDPRLLGDPYLDHDLAAQRRIRHKLEQVTSLDFREKPFAHVVEHLAGVLGDTLLIDDKALSGVGVSGDAPVTASVHGVPLKDALAWILEPLALTWFPEDDALVISTPEQAEKHLQRQLHSVRGLVHLTMPETETAWPGGMAFGGMGGFFGGMGAMGGGGFFGGGGSVETRIPAEARIPAEVGVSSIGEDESDQLASATHGAPVLPLAKQTPTTQATPDFESLIEKITETTHPTIWDQVGGPASLAGFDLTLDLVVSATREAHEQIESLLRRLRQLPVVDKRDEATLAEPPIPPPAGAFDGDGLLKLITTLVEATTWDQVGGPGSIASDVPRKALVVSQTDDVHDSLTQLFCQLRRSRYEILHGLRPWEAGLAVPMLRCLGIDDPSAELRLAKLPEPKADELAALAVRRLPQSGQWKWQYQPAGSKHSQVLTLRTSGRRLEIEVAGTVLRMEDDAVAAAYPGLGLVEHGNWAEAIRQAADTWLPWMPHRSNEQLARLFDVKPGTADSELSCLRLIPCSQPETAGTYLEVAFSRNDGRMHRWEAYLNGKLTSRLRFLEPDRTPGVWRTVTLEDAAGKTLARWELIDTADKAAEIPELTSGWDGYVQLDRRTPAAAIDPSLRRAFEAIQKTDWPAAMEELRLAGKSHPRHPLLLLLTAWGMQHDERFGSRADAVALLQEAAASRASQLPRFIAEHFPWLTPQERYEILRQMPSDVRQPADWDRLARAAMDVRRWEEAYDSVQMALKSDAGADVFERRRCCLELLLRLGRGEEAAKEARNWAGRNDVTLAQLATMAELLAQHGSRSCADELFDRALASQLPVEQRSALLRRRAGLLEGLPRWKLLVEAAALLPQASSERDVCMATVCGELETTQAEIAAVLADGVKDVSLRAALRVRQAELVSDDAASAELLWDSHRLRPLSKDQLDWACRLWNQQRQSARVIQIAEQQLRSGDGLSEEIQTELARAYRQLSRDRNARRAATRDAPPGK